MVGFVFVKSIHKEALNEVYQGKRSAESADYIVDSEQQGCRYRYRLLGELIRPDRYLKCWGMQLRTLQSCASRHLWRRWLFSSPPSCSRVYILSPHRQFTFIGDIACFVHCEFEFDELRNASQKLMDSHATYSLYTRLRKEWLIRSWNHRRSLRLLVGRSHHACELSGGWIEH